MKRVTMQAGENQSAERKEMNALGMLLAGTCGLICFLAGLALNSLVDILALVFGVPVMSPAKTYDPAKYEYDPAKTCVGATPLDLGTFLVVGGAVNLAITVLVAFNKLVTKNEKINSNKGGMGCWQLYNFVWMTIGFCAFGSIAGTRGSDDCTGAEKA